MDNIYITLSEGTRSLQNLCRQFKDDVVEKTFDDLIKGIIEHQGDDLNQPYNETELAHLIPIREAYNKGTQHGTLHVAYRSSIDASPRSVELKDIIGSYDDFLESNADILDLGGEDIRKGAIVIKNNTRGGYR